MSCLNLALARWSVDPKPGPILRDLGAATFGDVAECQKTCACRRLHFLISKYFLADAKLLDAGDGFHN